MYSVLSDVRTLYVKLDDDITYIHSNAIYRLAQAMLAQNILLASANVVNHPIFSKYHNALGLFEPNITASVIEEETSNNSELRHDLRHLPRHPHNFDGNPWGKTSLRSGPHALLQLLTFSYYLAHHRLSAYNFGLLDFQHRGHHRWSINCFIMSGKDMRLFNATDCNRNDELYISSVFPQHVSRPAVALGDAYVVHFAYSEQR